MHDAIIFSLRWHQIIEEELPALVVLFQEKRRRVSQQGRISDSKIGREKKKNVRHSSNSSLVKVPKPTELIWKEERNYFR